MISLLFIENSSHRHRHSAVPNHHRVLSSSSQFSSSRSSAASGSRRPLALRRVCTTVHWLTKHNPTPHCPVQYAWVIIRNALCRMNHISAASLVPRCGTRYFSLASFVAPFRRFLSNLVDLANRLFSFWSFTWSYPFPLLALIYVISEYFSYYDRLYVLYIFQILILD